MRVSENENFVHMKARVKRKKGELQLRACLHGGGGPQIDEVTCGRSPHLTGKRVQIKMRDYMDRRVTPPKRVTSPTWGPTHLYKQAPRLDAVAGAHSLQSAVTKEFSYNSSHNALGSFLEQIFLIMHLIFPKILHKH